MSVLAKLDENAASGFRMQERNEHFVGACTWRSVDELNSFLCDAPQFSGQIVGLEGKVMNTLATLFEEACNR